MEREIIQTLDGSTTIHLKEWDECYHSKHGAIQEAKHVFIQNGLSLFPNQSVSILEIGFGTGLNAFITLLESQKLHQSIHYVGVEAYPVNAAEVIAMNYVTELNAISDEALFKKMHESNWDEKVVLHPEFELIKRKQFFHEIDAIEEFDLIYFDAFAAIHQPEMWTTEALEKVCRYLKPSGVFVTYAITGNLKRSMKSLGFAIEKAPGAPGKREMLRAVKLV